jgi:hypothetical protein
MVGAGAVGATLSGSPDGTTTKYRGLPHIDRVVVDEDNYTTTNLNWLDVTNTKLTHWIPPGQTQVLIITVSAESACWDNSAPLTAYCILRVLVDGVEARPTDMTIFDSAEANGNGTAGFESHAAQWVAQRGSGSHTIQLQYAVDEAGGMFTLQDIVMTVETARTW